MNKLKQTFLIISFVILAFINLMACNCFSSWNDSFRSTAENSEFLALIKIVSFDEYLDREINEFNEKMPYSMTVEIIKKYKGKENRKRIKILGDNGMLCRPYLSDFELDGYYLIAPNPIDNSINTNYDFFICRTEYLKVDLTSNLAYGNYSLLRKEIDLKTFESKLKYGDWDMLIIGLLCSVLGLVAFKMIRYNFN